MEISLMEKLWIWPASIQTMKFYDSCEIDELTSFAIHEQGWVSALLVILEPMHYQVQKLTYSVQLEIDVL